MPDLAGYNSFPWRSLTDMILKCAGLISCLLLGPFGAALSTAAPVFTTNVYAYTLSCLDFSDTAPTASCSSAEGTAYADALTGTGGLVKANSGSGESSLADANVNYTFEFAGPSTATLPITVIGAVDTTLGAKGYAGLAQLIISDPNDSSIRYLQGNWTKAGTYAGCGSIPNCSYADGSFTLTGTLQSNTIYNFLLNVDTSGGAYAFLDPTINIDPSFPNGNEFTLEAAPGVFSSSPATTPEPGSLGILLLGLAAISASLRHRG